VVGRAIRQDIREEQKLCVFRTRRQFRIEGLKNVELRVERVGGVHVVIVPAAPKERLAVGHDLDVFRVDHVTTENFPLFFAKIAADHTDRVHTGKKARRKRKMRRRTAKDLLTFTKRRLQRVKRDGTNYS